MTLEEMKTLRERLRLFLAAQHGPEPAVVATTGGWVLEVENGGTTIPPRSQLDLLEAVIRLSETR